MEKQLASVRSETVCMKSAISDLESTVTRVRQLEMVLDAIEKQPPPADANDAFYQLRPWVCVSVRYGPVTACQGFTKSCLVLNGREIRKTDVRQGFLSSCKAGFCGLTGQGMDFARSPVTYSSLMFALIREFTRFPSVLRFMVSSQYHIGRNRRSILRCRHSLILIACRNGVSWHAPLARNTRCTTTSS